MIVLSKYRRCVVFFVTFSVILSLLYGCPLESNFPLAPASECRVDRSLIGVWKSREKDEGQPLIMRMYHFNDHEILIVSEKEPDMLSRAYTTTICGERFLNVQDVSTKLPSGRKWTFAHYSITGDVLSLRIVSNRLFRERSPADSDELKRLVEENIENPLLYLEDANNVIFDRIEK